MSVKTLKTRFQLRYDTLANWMNANPVLKAGEIAVASIPTGASGEGTYGQVTKPAILFKVGDGETAFDVLPFASGLAADVYSWAKASSKPTYTKAEVGLGNVLNVASYSKTEIDNMLDGIEGQLQVDTNTEYQLVNTGTKLKLQSKAKGASSWIDEDEYDLATILANTFDAKGAAATAKNQAVAEAQEYADEILADLQSGVKGFTKILFPAGTGAAQILVDDNNNYINITTGLEINGQKLETLYAPKSHTHAVSEVTGLQNTLDGLQEGIDNLGTAHTTLENKVNAFLDAEGLADTTLDTLHEIQEYITGEASAADQMVKDIADNSSAIESLDDRVTVNEGHIQELQGQFAEANHSHSNKTVLDGITATKVTNWDNEVGAKTAAATAQTKANQAYTLAEGKEAAGTAQTLINALDVTVNGMGAGKTLKTLTETDGKIAATFQDISITKSQITDFGSYDAAGAASTAEANAKAYTDTEVNKLATGAKGFSKVVFPAEQGATLQVNSNGRLASTSAFEATALYENGSKLSDLYLGKTAKAADSAKLNGQEASYYATAAGLAVTDQNLNTAANTANDAQTRVGAAEDRLDAIEEVDILYLQGGGASDNY